MISRKSTILIAETYDSLFSGKEIRDSFINTYEVRVLKRDQLYDFLYKRNYVTWFLNEIKNMYPEGMPRQLKEFLMGLHTGDSLTNQSLNERQKIGQKCLKNLAENLLKIYDEKDEIDPISIESIKPKLENLKSQLELDGYIFKEGSLYQIDNSVINSEKEKNYLLYLSKKVSLPDQKIIKHHIKLADEHYLNSKWDDSISNSRKFLEAILSQIADELNFKKYKNHRSKDLLEKPAKVREYLEKEGLIEKKEKEAIAKVYQLLSNTGSHPYIAEKDQARLMLNLSLTFSQFVLLRYEGFLTKL